MKLELLDFDFLSTLNSHAANKALVDKINEIIEKLNDRRTNEETLPNK